MLKEWCAGALLLLILLLAGWNLRHLDGLTEELLLLSSQAAGAAAAEDWTAAASLAAELRTRWDGAEAYTHVFIRHPEIDAVTDAVCTLEGAAQGRDTAAYTGALHIFIAHLTSIRGMERPTFGSIF